MRRGPRTTDSRRGVTLLEVMAAVTLSATMMASSFVVMRSSYTAWKAHEEDFDTAIGATAVLRHLVQNARQAVGVNQISQAIDPSGTLTIALADGSTRTWAHAGNTVTLAVDGGTPQLISAGVSQFTLTGFRADGVTPTAQPDEVQVIRAEVVTPQPTGGTRTISSYTWVRSW